MSGSLLCEAGDCCTNQTAVALCIASDTEQREEGGWARITWRSRGGAGQTLKTCFQGRLSARISRSEREQGEEEGWGIWRRIASNLRGQISGGGEVLGEGVSIRQTDGGFNRGCGNLLQNVSGLCVWQAVLVFTGQILNRLMFALEG